jgi:hypothetical protein
MNSSPLSEKKTNESFFDELLSKRPIVRNRQLPFVVHFESWTEDFALLNESFIYKLEERINFSDLPSNINRDKLKINNTDLQTYLNRKVVEMSLRDIPNIKLQGQSDLKSNNMYITKTLHEDPIFFIADDCVYIMLSIKFFTKGDIRDSLFDAIDLTKFVIRDYDGAVEVNKDNCVTMVGLLNNEAYCPPDIDIELLSSWCKFRLFSLIFNVIFNPFFEQDGLMHMSISSGETVFPEFDIPSCIQNIHFSNLDLKLTDTNNQYVNFNI